MSARRHQERNLGERGWIPSAKMDENKPYFFVFPPPPPNDDSRRLGPPPSARGVSPERIPKRARSASSSYSTHEPPRKSVGEKKIRGWGDCTCTLSIYRDSPMLRVCWARLRGSIMGATRACVAVWRSAPAANPIAERAAIFAARVSFVVRRARPTSRPSPPRKLISSLADQSMRSPALALQLSSPREPKSFSSL